MIRKIKKAFRPVSKAAFSASQISLMAVLTGMIGGYLTWKYREKMESGGERTIDWMVRVTETMLSLHDLLVDYIFYRIEERGEKDFSYFMSLHPEWRVRVQDIWTDGAQEIIDEFCKNHDITAPKKSMDMN